MTVMDWNTYKGHALKRGSRQHLMDALTKKKDVAFYFRQGGKEVVYAVAGRCGSLEPVWAVLAAGYAATEVYSSGDGSTSAEKGLLEFFDRVGTRPKVYDYRPEDDDPKLKGASWFNEARMDLGGALAGLFPVLSGKQALVGDIQSENASVKDQGKITSAGTRTVHRLYMATAFTLLRNKHNGSDRDGVVALIVDKTGNIISWGQKNPDVTCWHGETSAILRLGGAMPAGCCVYSTLKPCHMCSGLIYTASGGTAKVFWGQDDPGWAAQGTVLDSEKMGCTLDGNKDQKNVARALVIGQDKSSLAKTLDTSFTGQKRTGQSSTIDYITSPATQDFLLQAQGVLQSKFQKYNAPKAPPGNQNTQQVINYLIKFLRDAAKVKGI